MENLESKLMELPPEVTPLLQKYRAIRNDLSGVEDGLELKCDGVGVLS